MTQMNRITTHIDKLKEKSFHKETVEDTCEALLKDLKDMSVHNTSEQNMGWHNCLVEMERLLKGDANG